MGVTGTVLSIFLLIFIGYGVKKLKLLRSGDADILNTLVIYLTLPPFIFNALYDYHRALPSSMIKVTVIGFVLEMVVLGLTYLIGKALKLNRSILGGLMLVAAFGNTGFLGYPVVVEAFTDKSALVTAVLYDELAMAVPLNTLGVLIVAWFAGTRVDRTQLLKVLTLPALWAIPVALMLRPYALPDILLVALKYLGNGTIPLVMISLGLSLSTRSLQGFGVPVLIASVLKLVVLPALTHYGLVLGGVSGVVYQSGVLEAGMPSAMMSCVIASQFGGNARFVAGVIFVTTLLSLATIPLTLQLLGVH